jgi:hypothetical protein
MRTGYLLVTPDSPCFLKSGDFKGLKAAIRSLEPIGSKLIDSKEVGD